MTRRRFPRAGWLHAGYRPKEVDAFLHRVEVSLRGLLPPVSATEIRRAGFQLVRRGYDVAAVDAAMDQLEERAVAAQSAVAGRRGQVDPEGEAAYLREQLAAPYMRRLPHAGTLRRGYEIDDVDDFLDRVSAALGGQGDLDVEAVRTVSFRAKRGGYDEDAVDETLDRVVELMLMLRGRAPRAEDGPGPDGPTPAGQVPPPAGGPAPETGPAPAGGPAPDAGPAPAGGPVSPVG